MASMTAAEAWRDYVTDGVPSSGVHEVKKSDARNVIGNLERLIEAGGIGGAVWKATKALLTADLAHAAGTLAVVYGDTISANNGLYVKSGSSGAGSWTQITNFLPGYQFVTALDDGGSSANAYTMDTNPRLPAGDGVALVEFVVPATNTSGTVTVSFDGDPALTIKTASGNSPAVGGLIEGMPVSGVKIGTNFFMRSDQASAAIQTSAESAAAAALGYRDQAAAYADFIRNNWTIAALGFGTGSEEDIELLVDPGSVNNMFVVVDGVTQLVTQGAYSLVYSGGDAFIRMTVPLAVPYEVKVGNAITVGTPSDGSVTEQKLAAKAVTFAKSQDIATARIVGRSSAGVGPMQELDAPAVNKILSIGFSANKNGTDQVGLSSDTFAKVTFGTEQYDVGAGFDASLSRWTPPEGIVSIDAQVTIIAATLTAGQESIIAVYKNGSLFKAGNGLPFGTAVRSSVSIQDYASGTDYYEIYAKAVGTGITINGGATATYFMGSL